MGINNTIRRMFGASSARNVMRSPWSNSDHLESVVFHDLFGIDAQGPVSRSAAIKLATVAKGRDVLTGRISRLPLVDKVKGKPAEKTRSLLVQPEDGYSLVNTLTWLFDDLFFEGVAWWRVTQRDFAGFPLRVSLVRVCDVETNDAGQMIKANGVAVNPGDGIRFDGPHEGVLSRGADTIRRAIRLNRAAAKAENNPVPSIDLHNEGENLNKEEIKTLVSSWETARTTSGVGYSSKGMKVNVLGQPAEQLMIDGRKAINLELARHMGAPEWAVSVAQEGSSFNYTNKASRNTELIDEFLAPYMAAFTSRLGLDDITPHGTTVDFDTSTLTAEDTATRYANLETGIRIGLFDLEYAKESEGFDPKGPNTNEA